MTVFSEISPRPVQHASISVRKTDGCPFTSFASATVTGCFSDLPALELASTANTYPWDLLLSECSVSTDLEFALELLERPELDLELRLEFLLCALELLERLVLWLLRESIT